MVNEPLVAFVLLPFLYLMPPFIRPLRKAMGLHVSVLQICSKKPGFCGQGCSRVPAFDEVRSELVVWEERGICKSLSFFFLSFFSLNEYLLSSFPSPFCFANKPLAWLGGRGLAR